jgi:hypothetical protein
LKGGNARGQEEGICGKTGTDYRGLSGSDRAVRGVLPVRVDVVDRVAPMYVYRLYEPPSKRSGSLLVHLPTLAS